MNSNNKPTLWILDQNIDQQMVFDELLSDKYNTLFFDDLGSLCRYQAHSDSTPDLLIVSLKAVSVRVADFIDEHLGIKTLALAPFSTEPILVEQLKSTFDKTLSYPFSRNQVLESVEELCAFKMDRFLPLHSPARITPVLSIR